MGGAPPGGGAFEYGMDVCTHVCSLKFDVFSSIASIKCEVCERPLIVVRQLSSPKKGKRKTDGGVEMLTLKSTSLTSHHHAGSHRPDFFCASTFLKL